jgi:hypothetical protein
VNTRKKRRVFLDSAKSTVVYCLASSIINTHFGWYLNTKTIVFVSDHIQLPTSSPAPRPPPTAFKDRSDSCSLTGGGAQQLQLDASFHSWTLMSSVLISEAPTWEILAFLTQRDYLFYARLDSGVLYRGFKSQGVIHWGPSIRGIWTVSVRIASHPTLLLQAERGQCMISSCKSGISSMGAKRSLSLWDPIRISWDTSVTCYVTGWLVFDSRKAGGLLFSMFIRGVNPSEREASNSFASTADVTNAWNFTFTDLTTLRGDV